MGEKVKVAGVQMEPKILEKERNLSKAVEQIAIAAREGARLIVLPECALTGYCFSSLEEALPVFEPLPGPSTDRILTLCRELNVYVVVGLLEKDGDKYYNTAALLGPEGLVGKHRKLHLIYLGIDRFVNHGNLPLTVYETEVGRIGMAICYDLLFPEHARALGLRGADFLIMPANWIDMGMMYPDTFIPARAMENHMFCVGINRVGEERGFKFLGRSRIAHWAGLPLADGKAFEEDIIYAEIDPSEAREKYMAIIPGEMEVDYINDRRPEFYGVITEPLADTSRIRH